ncbi:MAG: hypothetical protein U0269_00510 [Polyangiales bacterium]
MPTSERLRDIDGDFPLSVLVWLDQHPSSTMALALAVSAPSIRWTFRFGADLDVVIRGARVETYRAGGRERVGSARVHGTRSAADFDFLAPCPDDAPYAWPALPYPVTSGFACDREGAVARFVARDASATTPGLLPKLGAYPDDGGSVATCIERLGTAHSERVMAYPPRAFAATVRDLLSALAAPDVVGPARAWVRFVDRRAVLWPEPGAEFGPSLLAALHARRGCLGCSRFDPRDVLSNGTWLFAQPRRGLDDAFVREAPPAIAASIEEIAEALGRTPAELAATQLDVRFADVPRVTSARVRLPA